MSKANKNRIEQARNELKQYYSLNADAHAVATQSAVNATNSALERLRTRDYLAYTVQDQTRIIIRSLYTNVDDELPLSYPDTQLKYREQISNVIFDQMLKIIGD